MHPARASRHPNSPLKVLTGVALSSALAGCAPERDPVLANHVLAPDDRAARLVWSDGQRTEALEAMREAMATAPAERTSAAKSGVRWSDVPLAVYWGASAAEMAIVDSVAGENSLRFTLTTIRDEPATLLVERVDDPPPLGLAIRATATVGIFGDGTAEARLLEAEFRKALEALGRKPGFEDEPAPRAKR